MKYNLYTLRNLLLFYFEQLEIIELLEEYIEINLQQQEKISPSSYIKLLKTEKIIITRRPVKLKTFILLVFSTLFFLILTINPCINMLNPLYSILFILPYFYFIFLLINSFTELTSHFIEEATGILKTNKHSAVKIYFVTSPIMLISCIIIIFIQFNFHIFPPILHSNIFSIVVFLNLFISYIGILFSIFSILFHSNSNYCLFMLSVGHYIIMGNIYKLFTYYELNSLFDIQLLTQILFIFSLYIFCIWSFYRKEDMCE